MCCQSSLRLAGFPDSVALLTQAQYKTNNHLTGGSAQPHPSDGWVGGGGGLSREHPPPGKPPHGFRVCIWMQLVNSMGNGTADPRSSQTGQVIRGLR